MHAWSLVQHLDNPYPTEAQKSELATRCGITVAQVGDSCRPGQTIDWRQLWGVDFSTTPHSAHLFAGHKLVWQQTHSIQEKYRAASKRDATHLLPPGVVVSSSAVVQLRVCQSQSSPFRPFSLLRSVETSRVIIFFFF